MDATKLPGVYAIINTVNGKRYVGSSTRSIRNRWRQHRLTLKANCHDNGYLQRAWNKYGEQVFDWQVLENCEPEQCLAREQFWIDELRSVKGPAGYNICPTAGNSRGTKHTEETKRRMSALKRGKSQSPEAIENRRIATTGLKRSLATRETMRKSQIEKYKNCPEVIEKIRETVTKYWSNPENRKSRSGLKRTAEQCERMRRAWKLRRRKINQTKINGSINVRQLTFRYLGDDEHGHSHRAWPVSRSV